MKRFEDNMTTVKIRSGILPGEEVPNGYAGQVYTVPAGTCGYLDPCRFLF